MFEIFERRREHFDTEPGISISEYGKMAFNKPASDFIKTKNWKSVVLLFDKESKKIGIRIPKRFNEAEYKLNYHGDNYFVFNSPSFIKFIKYPLSRTRRYSLEWNEKEQMYIVDLSEIYDIMGAKTDRKPAYQQ